MQQWTCPPEDNFSGFFFGGGPLLYFETCLALFIYLTEAVLYLLWLIILVLNLFLMGILFYLQFLLNFFPLYYSNWSIIMNQWNDSNKLFLCKSLWPKGVLFVIRTAAHILCKLSTQNVVIWHLKGLKTVGFHPGKSNQSSIFSCYGYYSLWT